MLFGKYCLLERIAVGGMAEVFRSKPLPAGEHGKMLALKRILPHLAEDEKFITMFVDEAKLTVQLKHPNIVETYELGNFQGSHYILMEYLAGADVLSVQKRLRENKRIMSVAQACYIGRQTARGLEYVHNATDEDGDPLDLIHRDVSPQNIRITYDGRVKLIDFGIAKGEMQRTKTQAGVLKGKFGYMSPEQAKGNEIDYRTDVFTLGICLWEMLTNRRMFNGDNEFETLQMVLEGDYTPPSELNSQVPPEVDEIVLKALAVDPDERFQTAREMARALDGFLQGIDEPFTQDYMTSWMAKAFSEELAEERRKRELYQKIQEPEDVKWFNEEVLGEEAEMPEHIEPAESGEAAEEPAAESADESARREAAEEDDQIWDPDFAPDEEEEVDPEEFASDHTVVAAGGFEPESFEDEEDEIIGLADDDLEEVEVEEEVGGTELAEGQVEELEDEWDEPGGDHEDVDHGAPGPDEPAIGPGADAAPDATGATEAAHASHGGDTGGAAPSKSSAPSVPSTDAGAGGGQQASSQPRRQTGGGARETAQPGAGDALDTAQPGGTASDEPVEPGDDSRFLRFVGAAAALLALVGAGYVGWSLVWGEKLGYAGGKATGTLVVDVHPTLGSEGEILVDGQSRGNAAPVTVSGLSTDTSHLVQVRHPAYNTGRRRVKVSGGAIKNVQVELKRDSTASGWLKLVLEEGAKEGKVFVDGERIRKRAKLDRLSVAPGRHLIEVLAENKEPWTRIVEVGAGETIVEHVYPRSHSVSLTVDATRDVEVAVDGDGYGRVPAEVKGLAPGDEHRITLSEVDADRTVWRSAVAFPRMGTPQLKIDLDAPSEEYDSEDIGRLVVETGEDWWGIYVDGIDTGFTSPVGGDSPIPVEPGEHTVRLRRGNEVHQVDIEVGKGETVSIDKDLKFTWDPSSGESG
ncbi:MAG: protein kinase [Bradymonadaceae bacterium]